jgi:hypothetical protein
MKLKILAGITLLAVGAVGPSACVQAAQRAADAPGPDTARG